MLALADVPVHLVEGGHRIRVPAVYPGHVVSKDDWLDSAVGVLDVCCNWFIFIVVVDLRVAVSK